MNKSKALTIALIVVLVALAACAWFMFGNVGGISYPDADKYTAGDTTIASGVENLFVDWTAGAVNIEFHNGEEITVSETANRTLSDDEKLRWWLDGNTLRIRYSKPGIRLSLDSGKVLTVSLPKDLVLSSADIGSTSGDLQISSLTADEIRLNSTSGNIEAYVTTPKLTAASTSGDMNLSPDEGIETVKLGSTSGSIFCALGDAREVIADSTSGGVQITSFGEIDNLEIRTTSGSVYTDIAKVKKMYSRSTSGTFNGNIVSFSEAKIDSTSGNVIVNLLPETGFTCKVSTSSGSFSSDLSLTKDGNTYTCGDGKAPLSISTSSGSIRLGEIQ